jgi:hypothetical protein
MTATGGWCENLLAKGTHENVVRTLMRARVVFPKGRFALLYNETKERLIFSKVRYSEEAGLRVSELPDLFLAKNNRKVRYYEVTVPMTPVEKMSGYIFEEEIEDDSDSVRSNNSIAGCLSVGMASPKFALTSLPGYGDPTKYSVSYDGDNGMKYLSTLQCLSEMNREFYDAGTEFKFSSPFGRPGDVVGAGILFTEENEDEEKNDQNTAKERRLCKNCGYAGHTLRNCFFTRRCFACGSRSHRRNECTELHRVKCDVCVTRGKHSTVMCPVMRQRRAKQRQYVFFTLNGKFMGAAFCCHGLESTLPFIAFQDYVLPVQINFGRQPFKFDLNMLCQDDIIEICKESSKSRIKDTGGSGDEEDSDMEDYSDDDSDRTDHTPDLTDDDRISWRGADDDVSDDDSFVEDDRSWVCSCGDSDCENSTRPRRLYNDDEDGNSENGRRTWCDNCGVYHYKYSDDDDDDDDDEEEDEIITNKTFVEMMRMAVEASLRETGPQHQEEEEEKQDNDAEVTDSRMEGIPPPRQGVTVRFRSKPTS